MRVKDRVENGVSKRVGREVGGGGGRKVYFAPLSFFGSRSISCLEKTENPVPQYFFAPKTNGNAC